LKLREDRWLEGRLKAWQAEGLVTAKQVEGVQAYEQEHRKRMRLDPVWILAGFAGLCVVLGVALVVAHNWERIPAWIRQAGYLCGLIALGWAYIRWQDRPMVAKALGAAWVIAPLIGIGLWAQIYQLSGDPFRPFFIAWLFALPLVWIGQDPFVVILHQILLGWGLFAGLYHGDSWVGLGSGPIWLGRRFSDGGMDGYQAALHLTFALALWAALLAHARRFTGTLARQFAWAWCLIYLMEVATSQGVGLGWNGPGLAVLGSLAAMAWSGGWVGLQAQELEGPVSWLGAVVLFSQTFEYKGVAYGTQHAPGAVGGAYLVLVVSGAVAGLAVAPLEGIAGKPARVVWLKAALLLPALVAVVGCWEDLRPVALFLANVGMAVTAALWMFNGVERGLPKVVNRGVLIMAVLVLTRFFDLFDSLLDSGLAFILGGLGLGLLAWVLEKGRRRLLAMANEVRA
jgi:hypothetical protein